MVLFGFALLVALVVLICGVDLLVRVCDWMVVGGAKKYTTVPS